MYAVVALFLVALFSAAVLLLPHRFEKQTLLIIGQIRAAIFGGTAEAINAGNPEEARPFIQWARLWGWGTASLLVIFGFWNGAIIQNRPGAIAAACWYSILAMAGSAFLLVSARAYLSFLGAARESQARNLCGLQGFWTLSGYRRPRELMNSLRARMAQSRQVGIVDVTGHLFFGRGAGATGTLFQEAIASLPNVPLHLLLFKPESGSVDPECKRATVFQTLLGEMEANEQTFAQRLNATLHAVGVLNSQRPPEGQVTVRFYSEKPAVRALLLDDAAFIAPWDAREENASLVFLEAARRSGGASLYETFRRHFSRLWSHSTGFGPPPKSASFRAAGSTVVRRAAPAAAPAPR